MCYRNMSWVHLVLITLAFDLAFSIEPRIFGAEKLRVHVHKYLVKLKIFNDGYTGQCSGTILDNQWVITSAHCFSGNDKYVAVYHQLEEGPKIIAKAERQSIIQHPLWLGGNHALSRSYDIALLRTTPMKFDSNVQPIKLSKRPPKNGESAIIAGFGASEAELEPPREGFVTVDWCPYGMPGLLCSESLVRAGPGDSGGPLVSQGRLIGVTAASCKEFDKHQVCITVYVSIISNIKWLKEVLLQ